MARWQRLLRVHLRGRYDDHSYYDRALDHHGSVRPDVGANCSTMAAYASVSAAASDSRA